MTHRFGSLCSFPGCYNKAVHCCAYPVMVKFERVACHLQMCAKHSHAAEPDGCCPDPRHWCAAHAEEVAQKGKPQAIAAAPVQGKLF